MNPGAFYRIKLKPRRGLVSRSEGNGLFDFEHRQRDCDKQDDKHNSDLEKRLLYPSPGAINSVGLSENTTQPSAFNL